MFFSVVWKRVSGGLEMYFPTSFQIPCYNLGQDHARKKMNSNWIRYFAFLQFPLPIMEKNG